MTVDAINSTGSSKSGSSLDKLNSDFDMFLKLLTTQLQNQDPLDPMDNAEMTNQLVQFANVEQQIAQNKNLEQMITLLNAQSAASSVVYIDRDVQYSDSSTVYAGAPVTFGYTPETSAEKLSIKVLDSEGNIVRTLEGEKSAQRHTVVWDGKDNAGNEVPQGQYTFFVDARDASNKAIAYEDDITGHVTGSAIDASGSYVLIGDLAVSVTKIISVKKPAASS